MAEWTLDKFAAKVQDMRTAQKAFYRHRRHATGEAHHALLMEALDLEKQVDRALEEIATRLPLFDVTSDPP